jgi:hypothetical protein
MLAHNGEINTVKGNKNWMKSHEIRMAHRPSRTRRGREAGDPGWRVGFRGAGFECLRALVRAGSVGADGEGAC